MAPFMSQTEAISTAEPPREWPAPRRAPRVPSAVSEPVTLLALAGVGVALLAYVAGLRALFVPLLVLVNAAVLPMPRLMRSVVGRLVTGLLYTTALLQIAAAVQFFAARSSGFPVAATITVLGNAVFVVLTPPGCRELRRIAVVTVSDAGALLASLVFLLPFAAFVAGHDAPVRIATIGGAQNIDGVNQIMLIGDQLRNQHLTYGMSGQFGGFGDVAHGYGVPLGFYTMLAFIESSVFTSPASLGWHGAELLYFIEYLVSGALLAFSVVKVSQSWFALLHEEEPPRTVQRIVSVLAGVAVAIPLVVFYQLNLVWLGFLSYSYVLLISAAAVLCLVEYRRPGDAAAPAGRIFPRSRSSYLIGALVLLYGVSATWPLLVPALGLTMLVSLTRSGSLVSRPEALKTLRTPAGLAIVAGLVLQLVPIYFQLHYGGLTGQININSDIGEFRYFMLLAGAVLVVLIGSMHWVPMWSRRTTIDVVVPLLILTTTIALEQLFTLGSATYYAVKSAMLPDILTIAIGTAVLFAWLWRSCLAQPVQLMLVTPLPAVVMLALLGTVPSVLRDARLLFPGHGNVNVGPNFNADAQHFVALGLAGKLAHYNAISLHWDPTQSVFTSGMELPYWANSLTYDASHYDRQASYCFAGVYSTWGSGRVDAAEQSLLLKQINACARLAAAHGQTYYVVTDPASAPYVSVVMDSAVHLVY